MKRVLFITPNNPELVDTGDKKYSWDILQSIKAGPPCFLHIVLFYDDKKNRSCTHRLASLADMITWVPFRQRPHWQLAFSKYPGMIASRKQKSMIRTITSILDNEQYDSIVVNMFKMSYLIKTIKRYYGKKIIVTHNVESLVSKSTYQHSGGLWKLVYYFDYLKTRYWEKKYLKDFEIVSTICDYDRKQYLKLGWCKQLFTLRPIIHVDDSLWQRNHTNTAIVCGTFVWTPKRINIISLLSAKNILLFKECGKQLLVVGNAKPTDVSFFNSIDNVTATGYVDSVEPYYQMAEVAIVPELVGGGFKLKITEAVQHRLPIVALKESITDDIIIPGVHYLPAEDFEDLIQKTIYLLDNIELQSRLVQNAISLFKEEYCINKMSKTLSLYL